MSVLENFQIIKNKENNKKLFLWLVKRKKAYHIRTSD